MDDHEDFVDSGPFCQHWSDPAECDEPCARCGHACAKHNGWPDGNCEAEGCQCAVFVNSEKG